MGIPSIFGPGPGPIDRVSRVASAAFLNANGTKAGFQDRIFSLSSFAPIRSSAAEMSPEEDVGRFTTSQIP